MGYYIAMGNCITCNQFFEFNPDKVPSIRVNGVREPVCQSCVEIINTRRKAEGLEPITPLPDAYAPQDENEGSL